MFYQGFCGFCALALIHSLTCLPDISFASFINKEMNKPRAGFTVVFHYSLNAIAPIFCMGPEFKQWYIFLRTIVFWYFLPELNGCYLKERAILKQIGEKGNRICTYLQGILQQSSFNFQTWLLGFIFDINFYTISLMYKNHLSCEVLG